MEIHSSGDAFHLLENGTAKQVGYNRNNPKTIKICGGLIKKL